MRPTAKGSEVVAVVQAMVPAVEQAIDDVLGPRRATALRKDLETLCTSEIRVDG